MAATAFQRQLCRLIAKSRVDSGESYVAGGVALNTLLRAPRISRDIDLFHDTDDALRTSSRLLKKAHLRRCRARAALRRTRKYASHLASRSALHLALFEQPEREWVFQHPARQEQDIEAAIALASTL